MKRYLYTTLLTAGLALLAMQTYSQKIQRVIVLGLDGFSVPGFKAARHPHIDSLFANGAISLTTRPVMPSVTLPNWTSHLTGSGPEEHGVTANDWLLDKHPLQPIAQDADGYYPSIFKVLKEQVKNVQIGYYYNWKELINSMNRKYIDEASFEDSDRFAGNYQKAVNFVVQHKAQPTFVFLYSVHTDHAGHKYHWMSPEYIAAIEHADSAIGAFVNELKAQRTFEGTHFLLITDHGGNPVTGHGGVSMDEMQVPWAVTGPKIKTVGVVDTYNSNKNTALVIAKIFGVSQLPSCWTGVVPTGIFK
ncbi:alkaline phosphatase family protein [Deminuibacter soli]|uniref:Nucleotide pyrophosphatase n=1 Tax=Deminuibacter soli TaxID=2291815 RepID=A0A3E1NPR1_9BACT|nr:alkaline phosphatase family protein [Deminuibacter soli]RFM29778.1 nucleotide pyrophosphatase [Deminuibacter soli]